MSVRSAKRAVVEAALADGHQVMLYCDGRICTLPEEFKRPNIWLLVAQTGLAVPIPDLDVSDDGIKATLSFDRAPFECFIPWAALFAVESSEHFRATWGDDVPSAALCEKHQAEHEAEQKEQKRSHLHSVPMPDDEDVS